MPRKKRSIMKCHVKKNLKKGLQWDLKRDLRCNATQKKIYHTCHMEKNKKTMFLKFFFNSVWNFVIFQINFNRVMFRVFSIGIFNWKDFLLNASRSRLRMLNASRNRLHMLNTLWNKLHMYITLKQWTRNVNIFLKIFNNLNWNHFQWYYSCFLHFPHFSSWTLTTWCLWFYFVHQFWFEQPVSVFLTNIVWIQM